MAQAGGIASTAWARRVAGRTVRSSLPAALGALLVAALVSPGAQATTRFGFNDSPEIFAAHADAAERAGASIVRIPVSWELVEPTPGERDFTDLDAATAAVEDHGMRVLFALNAAPGWAAPNCHPALPIFTCGVGAGFEDDYVSFARRLLRRYPGSRVQAWNEPDILLFGAMPPKRMARLTNDLHRAAPGRVIGPAPSPGNPGYLTYLKRVYARIDRRVPLAVHLYPRSRTRARMLRPDWHRIRRIAAGRPIWITEIGYAASAWGERGQAHKSVTAFRFLSRHGARVIVFHRLQDVDVFDSPFLSSFGFLREDGSRKPVYREMRRVVARRTRSR